MWFNDTKVVLEHMGCSLELWVRVADDAIRGQGQIGGGVFSLLP